MLNSKGIDENTERLIDAVQTIEQTTTAKITHFMQHPFFQTFYMDRFSISKRQINQLIAQFEKKERQRITPIFFLTNLSHIQKVSIKTLLTLFTKHQPDRKAKRHADFSDDDVSPRKKYRYHPNDKEPNPLIYERNTSQPALEKELETSGVRIATLEPTSPIRGYTQSAMKTPGGTKVRSLYSTAHGTLFKGASPKAAEKSKGRLALKDTSAAQIKELLPKLECERANTVLFTATLESIKDRKGIKRRQSALSIMGASATDVFRAHGIEIESAKSHLQHWSHLVAHFLTEESEITSLEKENSLINLVATTAAANYNILEEIELFIKGKLEKQETDQIHMQVTPTYTGENLIPDIIIYKLNWNETINKTLCPCHEIFYISAQSQLRINNSMHESIDILRKARGVRLFAEAPLSPQMNCFSTKTLMNL